MVTGLAVVIWFNLIFSLGIIVAILLVDFITLLFAISIVLIIHVIIMVKIALIFIHVREFLLSSVLGGFFLLLLLLSLFFFGSTFLFELSSCFYTFTSFSVSNIKSLRKEKMKGILEMEILNKLDINVLTDVSAFKINI